MEFLYLLIGEFSNYEEKNSLSERWYRHVGWSFTEGKSNTKSPGKGQRKEKRIKILTNFSPFKVNSLTSLKYRCGATEWV